MLEYIKGKLVDLSPGKAVIDVNGLGYALLIPVSTFSKMPDLGNETILYISTIIREDSQKSYGFISKTERNLFETVNEISGIGPKTSLALIGHLDGEQLQSAILNGNALILSKVPGVGKKTAERLILEMRDRMKKFCPSFDTPNQENADNHQLASDALSALMNLGYDSLKAQRAVKKALDNFDKEKGLSQLITSALKSM